MIDKEKKEILEKEELKEAIPEIKSNYERVVLDEEKKEDNIELRKDINEKDDIEKNDSEIKKEETIYPETNEKDNKENIEEIKKEEIVVEEKVSNEEVIEPLKKDDVVKEETYEKNTKITGDLLDKNEISFDVHKLIYSKSYYKIESVLSVLKKEINENNYQEIINLLNESKYANDFEIRGFLLAYLIDKKIEEPTNIIKNLNVDEVLVTYMFALINEKNKKKRKSIENLMKEEISLSSNKYLKKLVIESKKL